MQAHNSLDYYSQITASRNNEALVEAKNVLHKMRSSPNGFCSTTELAELRDLVYRSEYVKDAGRMQGNMIECSAALGRPAQAAGPFKPEFHLRDGTIAYRNLAALQNRGLTREALRLGSAYVVFGMEMPLAPPPIPMQLVVTTKAADQPSLGSATGGAVTSNTLERTTEGSGQIGNTLYVTHCLQDSLNCVTASTTVPRVLVGESVWIASITIVGGIAGVLLGIGFSFLHSRRREFDRQLRRAVQNDQLRVLYQPIVELETRKIVGAEALSRWTDEDGKEVDPEIFVKTAEDLGFVGSITKTVLQRVLRDFGPTLRSRPGFRVSVNLAAADLIDPGFLPMLNDFLERAQVRPEALVLEITERSAANSDVAMETIRNLRRMGHSIHIDDFGSGYSNLDKLLYLFADTIKIDKAFTKVIGTESIAVTILPQIISIAKSLHLEVVVEGVETTQQADYFSPNHQKIYAQGWLYGRPMTVEMLLLELAGNPALPQEVIDDYVFAARPGPRQVVPSMVA